MIVGGESGPGHRKMDLQWARDMQDRCAEESVAFFFKQHSASRTEMGIDALGAIYRAYPESWNRRALVL
jgi:protein gp37